VARPLPTSTAAGILVGALGAVVLAGWALDADLLKRVAPALPAMKPSTALAFVLAGIALVLARTAAPPWIRLVRCVAAALAFAVAVLSLVESAADVPVGLDRLLVRDPTGAAPPGGLAPVTAFGLAMSAAAFLLLDVGRAGAFGQALALATGALGFLNLVGYVYSLRGLRGLSSYTEMAVHTAFALVVLSVGILLAWPERGLIRMVFADTPAGMVVRRVLPVVIAGPLLLGWLVEAGRRAELYGPEFAMALFVVGTVAVLSQVVWSGAAALQRADVRRRRAETARQRASAEAGRAVARTVELTDANKALVETTARLRALERVNRLVSASLDFDAVLVAIARAAGDIMAAPVVSFWLVDEATRTVTVRAWSEPVAGADFPVRTFAFGEGLVGTVAATRQRQDVPDVFATSPVLRAHEWCRRHGLQSFYGIPVRAQDRMLAVLALSARAPLALGEEEDELLASFVAQAAVAIDNARLFAEAEARRRTAEAAEARYRGLFDRNLAGIFRATGDGRIVDCNEAMVRILGYGARGEVLALGMDDLYVDAAERRRVALPGRAGDRLSNAELTWRRADGAPISVLVNVAAIEGEGTEVVLEGIVVDITDRQRAAAAEREAEALRAVAKLAHAASHEINNPLAVVVAHLDLMAKRHAHDAETIQRLDRARSACHRIADMLVHMGHVTRLELYEQSPNLPPLLDLRRSSGAPEAAP
jgi:PAS domain S-box-containing protein